MKGDFSRDTFDPKRHYRRVLQQQGRVAVDADGNEQSAIDQHVEEATTYDVVGPSGVPKTLLPDGTPAGGFAIGVASGDLTVSPGRIYVEGVLCENERTDVTLLKQPDLPSATKPPAAGTYAIYLDVWERHLTALEDPAIREKALGGPDTASRAKTVWQVKAWQVPDGATCATANEPYRRDLSKAGMMKADTGAIPVDPMPCILPPESGYRRLENQLYRVEIHRAGNFGTATFKWSRENGSIVAAVVAPPNSNAATAAGPTFNVASLGRDAELGFTGPLDWIEALDDRDELGAGAGTLLQVDHVEVDAVTITTKTTPSTALDLALHPKLRRWEQTGNGLGNGILIANGNPIPLEDGIQVTFTDGDFRVGDYWLIPARTATDQEFGTIEWPLDDSHAPLALPPRGIVHHYAPLAIVSFDGNTFSNPQDCRQKFPPLTDITADDVSYTPGCKDLEGAETVQEALDMLCGLRGMCTVTFTPGAGWEKALAQLAKSKDYDAELCFPVGDFPLKEPVTIATKGNIKVVGCGPGTRLHCDGAESVLRFQGCASVSVRDIAARAGVVDPPDQTSHINGALTFLDCQNVTVENATLACASASYRGAACLVVRNDAAKNAATGTGSARVHGCEIHVGRSQIGILLSHVARMHVADNEVMPDPQAKPRPFAERIKDLEYQRGVAWQLVRGVQFGRVERGDSLKFVMAKIKEDAPAKDTSPPKVPPAKGAEPAPGQSKRPPLPKQRAVKTRSMRKAGPGPVGTGNEIAAFTDEAAVRGTKHGNVTVTVGSSTISFSSHASLVTSWDAMLAKTGHTAIATPKDLAKVVYGIVQTILTDAKFRNQFSAAADIYKALQRSEPVIGQRGITVGGRGFVELHIVDNKVSGMQQAIHVGVSTHRPPGGAHDIGGTATIAGNTIDVLISMELARQARHAIFVGNIDSLIVENNRARLGSSTANKDHSDGIRVYGSFGRRIIVRHNHVTGFHRGILAVAGGAPEGRNLTTINVDSEMQPQRPLARRPLWLIADNVFESSTIQIQVSPESFLVVNNWT